MYILAPDLHVFGRWALLIFHCLVRFNPKVQQRNIVRQKADPESEDEPTVVAVYDTTGALATSGSQEGPDAVPLAVRYRSTTPPEVSWPFF